MDSVQLSHDENTSRTTEVFFMGKVPEDISILILGCALYRGGRNLMLCNFS